MEAKPIEIPKEFRDMLQNVLDGLEAKTGRTFQFKIDEFGHNYQGESLFIGKFDQRASKIEVYDMQTSYTTRNCRTYLDEQVPLEETLVELNGIYNNVKEIRTKIDQILGQTSHHVKVSENSNNINYVVGGSVGRCHTIGKWRYVK